MICIVVSAPVYADMVCDTNNGHYVDLTDIRSISLNRNRLAYGVYDPMDWDKISVVDIRDVRGCQIDCSFPRCAKSGDSNAICVLGSATLGHNEYTTFRLERAAIIQFKSKVQYKEEKQLAPMT